MIRIGIVGAENSHTISISRILNIDKRVPGCRVVCVWGEAPRFARAAAKEGEIPEIVKSPEDMIGKVDAAVVDHRHPQYHLPAARPLLEAGLPLFIDKPFCYRVEEGRAFLERAGELSVPVCSFSVQPKQATFVDLQKKVRGLGRIISVISTGACDVKSRYGGVFFYGIHQVDMVLRLLNYDVTHVQVNRGKKNHTATLFSASGALTTLHLIADANPPFYVSVLGEKGRADQPIVRDKPPHLPGIQAFCRMFKTGKTEETRQSMLAPVAVLEALERSIRTRKKVGVRAVI